MLDQVWADLWHFLRSSCPIKHHFHGFSTFTTDITRIMYLSLWKKSFLFSITHQSDDVQNLFHFHRQVIIHIAFCSEKIEIKWVCNWMMKEKLMRQLNLSCVHIPLACIQCMFLYNTRHFLTSSSFLSCSLAPNKSDQTSLQNFLLHYRQFSNWKFHFV